MIEQLFKDIYDEELAKDAIINDRMEGFRQDYLPLHCLLRKYNIKSCFEVGCHVGFGTKIICNALGKDCTVYSLDLPDESAFESKQHPLSEGKQGVGLECDLPFILLRGDSRHFNYDKYPCEAYWIDAEHVYENVRLETLKILKTFPKIAIFHDTDIQDVLKGIVDGAAGWRNYGLTRIIDTRISYLLRNDI